MPASSTSNTSSVEHFLRQAVRTTAIGTLQDLLASALGLPLGLIAAALLSRTLGAEGYGLFSVALSIVLLVEVSITTGFSRTVVKFVAQAADWQPVAAASINAQFLAGLLAAGLLAALATPISTLLCSPDLVPYLRLLAWDIPIFSLATIHCSILVGRGQFSRRAVLTSLYNCSRLLLIVLFVSHGFSIQGAIWAYIGASVIFLICSRIFIHPPLIFQTGFSLAGMWDYMLPLLIFTLAMNLFQRLDLLIVKALDPTVGAAGYYGAAQNIAGTLGLLAAAFTPLLIATIVRVNEKCGIEDAKKISRESFRLILCLMPLIAAVAGTSAEIIRFVYGQAFAAAEPVLMLLLFTGMGRLVLAVASSILIAAGRPVLVAKLILPALPLAALLDILLIPPFGMVAAAMVTTVLTWGVVGCSLMSVWSVWKISFSATVFIRSLGVAVSVFAVMVYVPASGWWLFLKLTAGIFLSLAGLALVRELRYAEIVRWLARLQRPSVHERGCV